MVWVCYWTHFFVFEDMTRQVISVGLMTVVSQTDVLFNMQPQRGGFLLTEATFFITPKLHIQNSEAL